LTNKEPLRLVVKCNAPEYGDLYGLNQKISEEELSKVKPYMKHFTPASFENVMAIHGDPHGWMCTEENVPKVEEELNITETLAKHRKQQAESQKVYDKQRPIKEDSLDKVEAVFKDAPNPPQDLSILLKAAQEVYDPANSFRDNQYYGGGQLFIITKRSIWYIINNSREGNNKKINNIQINGENEAIGFRISYDEEIHELIKVLTDNNIYKGDMLIEEY